MKIQILRFLQGTQSTISRLLVDNVMRGYVLEDQDRGLDSAMDLKLLESLKVPKETCIPTGSYKVLMTKSERFGKIMPQLMEVPVFGGIRLHKGNYIGNTDGCPLPGKTYDADKNGYLRVWNSGVVFDPLAEEITKALKRKEVVWCEVARLYIIK